MRKSILSLLTVAFLMMVISPNLKADEELNKAEVIKANKEAVTEAKTEINEMIDRVIAINEMDLEELTKAEKKELKKEVRTIKKDLKAYSKSDNPAIAEAAAQGADRAGLYISGSALIIILLLLLLL
jgi:glycyl-tRNA synthetase (class II)